MKLMNEFELTHDLTILSSFLSPFIYSGTSLSCIRKEGVDVVSSLLSRGVDINGRNHNGDTALMRACYGGNEAVVSLLIERGANIEIKNKVSVCALPSHRRHSAFFA